MQRIIIILLVIFGGCDTFVVLPPNPSGSQVMVDTVEVIRVVHPDTLKEADEPN